MTIVIPQLLTSALVADARRILDGAEWQDGKATAGHQAAGAKDNRQVPVDHPASRQVGTMVLKALSENALFMAAALPSQILPPMFSTYSGGQKFGTHVDGAIRQIPGSGKPLRADLSATLFLSEPADYDGGELVIQDTYGTKGVKLPPGHLVLYPSTSLHHVTPVTRGTRLASFFWVQSMVRDQCQRSILFDLDVSIQRLTADHAGNPNLVRLTGVYHNLLRRWAEV